jgi:hypothetical protein
MWYDGLGLPNFGGPGGFIPIMARRLVQDPNSMAMSLPKDSWVASGPSARSLLIECKQFWSSAPERSTRPGHVHLERPRSWFDKTIMVAVVRRYSRQARLLAASRGLGRLASGRLSPPPPVLAGTSARCTSWCRCRRVRWSQRLSVTTSRALHRQSCGRNYQLRHEIGC